MVQRANSSAHLAYQYGDTEKLRIRIETHACYSESGQPFAGWLIEHVAPAPGLRLLDVGCGTGVSHPLLARHGVEIIAVDSSPAMVEAAGKQAREQQLRVTVIAARAEALPIADASVDRVVANHMLYHVPDQAAALREMRRVLKPGGRVVLATNAAGSYLRLHELHREAAEELGYVVAGSPFDRFNMDHTNLVAGVFPAVQRYMFHDALVFPTAEAALKYYTTGPVDAIEDLPADGSHRAALAALVGARINAVIQKEGSFRVPKSAGCFVAVV